MSLDLATLTVGGVLQGLKRKEFRAAELAASYFDRLERLEPHLNAFLTVTHDEALAAANEIDALISSGKSLPPLAGIPVAVKDVIVTKGIKTTAGAKILSHYIPPFDATVVSKLKQAGAVLIGKTNCDEFAMGASGEHSAFGPTHNPWDHDRVPGGSSSGSATAVAAGECLAALGSDTGGSIRQPAGFCGIVGLKPTYGRVSRYGLIALASSFDQIGPLARTVEDAATLFTAIGGFDRFDATSVDTPPIDLSQLAQNDLKGVRLGVPKEYFISGMDADVEASVRNAIKVLEELGAEIREVSLPHTEYAIAVYYLILPAEASANLARYDGIRYGQRVPSPTLRETYGRSRDEGLGPETKRRIMLGTYALSAGYYDAYYLKAQKVRTLIQQDFTRAFQEVDALVTPTSPTFPFRLGEREADPIQMYLADVFTAPANIAGIPGISMPVAWVKNLPVGLQLLGPHWSEERLLTIGAALERALHTPPKLPPIE